MENGSKSARANPSLNPNSGWRVGFPAEALENSGLHRCRTMRSALPFAVKADRESSIWWATPRGQAATAMYLKPKDRRGTVDFQDVWDRRNFPLRSIEAKSGFPALTIS